MASRNTPLDALRSGLQIENVTIAVPTPLSSLVTLPMGANLVWLQVLGGDLAYRLDGGLAPGGLVLTDGGYLPMNRAAMEQCVLTSGSGLTLVLQFFEGATGPGMPLPSKPGGSGPPPPPPGLTSLPTENVVHVMKNGNDATGQRDRLDLPFSTIDAAVAVVQSGDTLLVWPGVYDLASTVDVEGVNIVLMDALVNGPGAGWAFRLSQTSRNSCGIVGLGAAEIRGWDNAFPVIEAIGDGVFIRGLRISSSNAVPGILTQAAMDFPTIVNECHIVVEGDGVVCYSSAIISASIRSSGIGVHCPIGSGGSVVVNGTITCGSVGALCEDAGVTQTIYADITATAGTGARCLDGLQMVFGSITAGGLGARCDGGQQRIYGDIACTGGTSAYATGGLQVVYGNCLASGAGEATARVNGGTQEVYGSVPKAACNGTQTIHGDVVGDAAADGGVLTIKGRIGGEPRINPGGTLVLAGPVNNPIEMEAVTSVLIIEATARLYGNPSIVDVNTLGVTPFSCGAWSKFAPQGSVVMGGVLNVDAALP